MKNKNTKKQLLKAFGYACISLFLVCAQIFSQSPLILSSFKHLSFDQAETNIQNGNFQEIKQTQDGNLIQRFYTGIEEIPFVDYLVISNKQGDISLIPLLRDSSVFFERSQEFYSTFLSFEASLTKKFHLEKLFIIFIGVILSFCIIAKNLSSLRTEFYSFLYKPIWLITRRLRI